MKMFLLPLVRREFSPMLVQKINSSNVQNIYLHRLADQFYLTAWKYLEYRCGWGKAACVWKCGPFENGGQFFSIIWYYKI